MPGVFYGIDFGTTNTSVVQILENEYGQHISVPCSLDSLPFPSLLAMHKQTNEVLWGSAVKDKRQQLLEDHLVYSSFKSSLGIAYEDPANLHSPVNITARYLLEIKKFLKEQLSMALDEATFAIPVDFDPDQRRALKEAAKRAGIKVNHLISESTAAYMKVFDRVRIFGKVAVFDWGGGTLDISILERYHNELRELAVHGVRLGGDDIDRLLAEKIHEKIAAKEGLDSFDNVSKHDMDVMLQVCEKAKINLSDEDEDVIRLIDYGVRGVFTETIQYDLFRELIEQKTQQAVKALEEAIQKANISAASLGAIIMVGGSSRMRPIRKAIEEIYQPKGLEIIYPEEPHWAVAEGAAIIERSNTQYCLYKSVGVQLSDDSFFPVLEKHQPVPASVDGLTFGIVEEASEANFIFTDENLNRLDIVKVKVKGFITEGIQLDGSIDEDMIAQFTIQSSHMGADCQAKVEINRLHFYYDLEKLGLNPAVPRQKTLALPRLEKPVGICAYVECNEKATREGYCDEHCRYVKAESR